MRSNQLKSAGLYKNARGIGKMVQKPTNPSSSRVTSRIQQTHGLGTARSMNKAHGSALQCRQDRSAGLQLNRNGTE